MAVLQRKDSRSTLGSRQQTANSPPTITSVPPFTAQVDQSSEYNAVAVDPDNDPVVWSLLSAPDGVSIDALRGALRWTPGGAQIGFHEVIIQATDTQGASGIQGFGLNVSGTNSPPLVTSAAPTLAFAGDPYFYPVRAVDASNDPLSFSLTTGPDGMTIGDTTGLIQWTPATDQTGTHSVVLRVEDGRGGVGEQGFTLSVSGDGPNGPPVITSTPEFVATVGQTYEYQIVATDPEGLSLTYQRIDGPTGMIVDPATGLVTWTPRLDQLGANVAQLAALDPLGLGASQTFTITVREDSRPPALNNTPTTTAIAGKLYAFDMNVTDPDDDAKIFTLTGGPQGMTLDELGRLRWTPTPEDEGVHRVDVAIRDDRGSGITFGFDLTVVVDTAPPEVIVNVNTNPAGIGQDVTFWVAATDNIAIESIGLEIDGAPVALDGAGAATLSFDTFGTVVAVATATDTSGNTAQASLQLSVIDSSDMDAPVVQITAPEFDQVITGPIDVIGAVADDNLLFYKLEVAPVDTGEFFEIFHGTEAVADEAISIDHIRTDRSGAECNIHWPTDSSLLMSFSWRFHWKKIKKMEFFIARYSSSKSKKRLREVQRQMKELIVRVEKVLQNAAAFIAWAMRSTKMDLMEIGALPADYLPNMRRVAAVARRRAFDGEKAPNSEKVFRSRTGATTSRLRWCLRVTRRSTVGFRTRSRPTRVLPPTRTRMRIRRSWSISWACLAGLAILAA